MNDDWLEDPFGPAQGGAADPLTSKEYDRLANKYSDAGYREGITDGKLSTLQEGFDQSFAMSVPPSRRLGNLRGRAAALVVLYPTADKLRELVGELGKVRRGDVLPRDLEREEHEREEHGPGSGSGSNGFEFQLDPTDQREMEGLEQALEGFRTEEVKNTNGVGPGQVQVQKKREGELLDDLENRLRSVEQELRGSY